MRLLLEVEQILVERDLDLERNRDQLMAIRAGAWSLDELQRWAAEKEQALEEVYESSTIPYGPDEPLIKRHLLHCLEAHYGDLSLPG